MSESTGYNGWSNYETWLVALWLNNDQASYNALEALKAEDESEHPKAESLEELVRSMSPLALLQTWLIRRLHG